MWRLISLLATVIMLSSCSYPENQHDFPDPSGDDDPEDVSVAFMKSLYSGHPVRITKDYRIKGYVVSTDRYGNFHKTLAITDDTGGIEVRIDNERLFETYWPGDLLEIHCNSLTLGAYGGLVQLGTAPSGTYELGYIDANSVAAHIRIAGKADSNPIATHMSIADISPRWLSCLVRIQGVKFVDEEQGLLWCDPDEDTNRTVEDSDGNRLSVRTSCRAEFAYHPLPNGKGYIEGIMSWFNDSYQLRVVDPLKVSMND